MESYSVNERERELDVKQFIFYIIDNIKWVLLVGVIFGLLFGAYGYVKASKADSPELAGASVQDIIKKNRTKWNSLNTGVVADAFNDPLPGTYIANAKVYVDFDYSSIEGNENLDFTAMNTKIQGDIVALAGSNESRQSVIDSLNLHNYSDMNGLSLDDLKYMTSCGFFGANILQIQVVDRDEKRALAIVEKYVNNLIKTVSQYETVDNIKVMEKPCISHVSGCTTIGIKGYVKNAIKYGGVGTFIGIICVCGILFIGFYLNESVRTPDDYDFLNLNTLGIVSTKKEVQDTEYKRLIYNLTFLEKETLVLVPINNSVSIESLNEKIIKSNLKSCKISCTESFLENPDVVLTARKNTNVILVSAYGKTLVKDLRFVQSELKKANTEVLGVVILDAKHI